MSRDAFLSLVTADQPDAPPYFTYDAVLNSTDRPTLETSLRLMLNPLSVERVRIAGFERLVEVVGGPAAWEAAGLPVEPEGPPGRSRSSS